MFLKRIGIFLHYLVKKLNFFKIRISPGPSNYI